ncbi:RNase H domain-containing protein [Trichonephila clavipes]|nr:RNase H domain-containing protein [Trichonephila clavipes]
MELMAACHPYAQIPTVKHHRHPIHLQWVPSHARLPGNEVADDLAKAAASGPENRKAHMVRSSTEIYSSAKELICRTWVVPTVHPWYFQRTPWIRHIVQWFQTISEGILAIFDWSPEVHGKIVEVEIGGGAIYRPFAEFLRAKTCCHLYGAQGLGQRQAYF